MLDLWIVLSFLLTLVLHELGHAWAARRCGFDVDAIRFGIGPTMVKWRSGRTEISVGYPWTLFIGYVEWCDNGRSTIAQRMFVVSAGLLVNAVIMVAANFGSGYGQKGSEYWSALGVLNLGLIVLNLIPFVAMRRGYTKMWTDGGRIAGLIQEMATGRNFTDR